MCARRLVFVALFRSKKLRTRVRIRIVAALLASPNKHCSVNARGALMELLASGHRHQCPGSPHNTARGSERLGCWRPHLVSALVPQTHSARATAHMRHVRAAPPPPVPC